MLSPACVSSLVTTLLSKKDKGGPEENISLGSLKKSTSPQSISKIFLRTFLIPTYFSVLDIEPRALYLLDIADLPIVT
jgi:hypothetical protein